MLNFIIIYKIVLKYLNLRKSAGKRDEAAKGRVGLGNGTDWPESNGAGRRLKTV